MSMDKAISELRALCNREIQRANQSGFRAYPGGPVNVYPVPFTRVNDLLKACDKVFAAHQPALLSADGKHGDVVEAVARIIAPSSWSVMDAEKAQMLRKYKGQNIGYDPVQFQHKESMAKAREILTALASLPSAEAIAEAVRGVVGMDIDLRVIEPGEEDAGQ